MSEAGTKSPTIVQKLEGFGEEALQDIESFFADLVEAELPVAKQLVAAEIASIPADLIASKPLVAAAQVGQQALATAQAQAIQVGVSAVSVAAANAVNAINAGNAAPAAAQQTAT